MTQMLSNREHGSVDLFLQQALDDFLAARRTRTETLNELQHFITALDARNEKRLRRETAREGHRQAEAAGRATLFREYRLRIAEVIRDYGLNERAEAPADSRVAHG